MTTAAKPRRSNSERQLVVQMAKRFAEDAGLHSGRACIWALDGDATDRGFTSKDVDDMVANSGPNGRIQRVFGEEITAPWRLGHEDDGELEEAFREAAALPRTDHPALAHVRRPLWRAKSPTDPTPQDDGPALWCDFSDMPTPVRELTKTLYPWRSAEITRDYRGLGAAVLGVGMIGARRPGKKNLGPMSFNAEGGRTTVEVYPMKPVQDPVQFMDETPLGMKILQKAQAKAAANEDQTTDTVMAELLEATGLDSPSFQAALMGQGDGFTDQQLMAVANVLQMDAAELQAAAGQAPASDAPADDAAAAGDDDDEDMEVEQMAEKTKKAKQAKATRPAKGRGTSGDQPVTLTREEFAELQADAKAGQDLRAEFAELKADVAKARQARAASERKASAAEIEAWAQQELFAEGRVTGDNRDLVLHALKATHPAAIETFASEDDAHTVLKRVLQAVTTPKTRQGRTARSGHTPHRGDDTDKPKAVVEQYFHEKVQGQTRTNVKVETFAEMAGCTAEEIARCVELAKADTRIGAKHTREGAGK